ncbi:hypothetical protein BGZ68_007244 [Mortierella alpina]|nr:hypothetical protein BGZ68_007244 [Mortierella alpina]
MSPTAHDTHARPQDQVLVHIAPDQRLRSTSSIPSSSSPSVEPTKSAQDHDTAAKNEHQKDAPYHVNRDSKSHMHQLYHIDSDPNISSNPNSVYQAPSFKDATTIDMTEYPLDRNEDKDGDDIEFNKSENALAHYGQHHPLKAQQQQQAIKEEDSWYLKEDSPSLQEQSRQQDASSSLPEQAANQERNSSHMQHFHHDALMVPVVPESIASETIGGERGSISLHGQQQSDDIHSQESAALSESTATDQTLENQSRVESTAGAQHTKNHTTTSASTLIDLPSVTVPPSIYQDSSSTSASTASAAAAAAVSIVVTGVDSRPQRQQPHSSSLFDFFRGRKTSIPKSGSSLHQPSMTKSTTSSGSAVPAVPLATQVKAPLTGTPPSINKSRIFSTTTKTAQDSAYPRRGSSSSHNANTSIHYSHTKPTPQINKRETIGSLPMPIRSDRGMGHQSNRTSYASSHSTSSVFVRASNSGSTGSTSSSSPFAADAVPREDSSANAKTGTSASRQVSGVATATTTTTTTATSTTTYPSPTIPSQSITSSAHSTLTKVAAAVVGATVGKRRPTVTTAETSRETDPGPVNNRVRQGLGGGSQQQQPSLLQRPRPLITIVRGIDYQTELLNEENPRQRLVGLDQERLGQHATFMKAERSIPELREYISQLYKTILGKDEALEYSQKQISSLQSELDRVRAHAEEEKKELVDEMERTKEQIVTMEENFLLWRTKVHNDQMTLQDNLLNERLDKQDRIDELEEDLNASQEEADRLRSRLLVLEYEEGYHGPSSFLPDDNNASDMSSCSSSSSHTGSNSSNRGSSVSIAIEHGPMTVDTHRRRSADFTILEQRTQSFEALVHDLKRTLELERQQHQKELKTIRMQSQARFDKLEHDIQAAKMEATMYAEMMHEVVTENDDLRNRVKSASRVMRRHGRSDPNKNSGNSGGKDSSVVVNASTSRSNSQGSVSDHRSRSRDSHNFGFPSGIDDDDNESDNESDNDMEEIAI